MTQFHVMARALAILLHLAPPAHAYEAIPGWHETPEERLHRYYAIASDVSTVALEVCRGNVSCAKHAVEHALGVAFHESAFAPDVDLGPCYRGKDGKGPRCDGGNAHSMWQLHPMGCVTGPHAPKEPCAEVVLYDTDRRAAVREALKRMARSRKECSRHFLPPEEQLAGYAGGGCKLPSAAKKARELDEYIKRAASSPDLPKPPAPVLAPTEKLVLPVEVASGS
jgi:hypothetical protein